MNDDDEERLSLYGETPTQPDIDPAADGAPRSRPLVRWRLANDEERERLMYRGAFDD